MPRDKMKWSIYAMPCTLGDPYRGYAKGCPIDPDKLSRNLHSTVADYKGTEKIAVVTLDLAYDEVKCFHFLIFCKAQNPTLTILRKLAEHLMKAVHYIDRDWVTYA